MAAGLNFTSSPAGEHRWRFTLGTLFRAITVCGLAMFAVVQFGAIAGMRDLGIALAIATGIHAARTRAHRLWLAAALVAAIGLIPTVLAATAPYAKRSAVCWQCGMRRESEDVCGWRTKDHLADTDASRWAARFVPAEHQHQWAVTSREERPH